MSYITEILERTNLQHIREFLLHGVECCNVENENYETRIKHAEDRYKKAVFESFPNLSRDSEIFSELNNLLTVYENVNIEIGIRVGIQLIQETQKY